MLIKNINFMFLSIVQKNKKLAYKIAGLHRTFSTILSIIYLSLCFLLQLASLGYKEEKRQESRRLYKARDCIQLEIAEEVED